MEQRIEILRSCLVDVIQSNKVQQIEIDRLYKELESMKIENRRLKQKLKIKNTIINKGGR